MATGLAVDGLQSLSKFSKAFEQEPVEPPYKLSWILGLATLGQEGLVMQQPDQVTQGV